LPEGWVWTGFEQLADGTKNAIKAGPFGSSLKKSFYTPRGFKIYGQEQVIKGDPYFGDYFISRELFEQLQSCEVKPGDILISLVGTTGKVLILPDDCAPGIINPRLLKLSLNRSGVNPKFIKILLESATTRAFFKLAAHGGTMEILNLGILKTLPIALPPLAEQTRIVAEVERRLSVVEELEAVVSANLQRATRLRQSILQKAFAGDLLLHGDKEDRYA
jgi:type I restriction enzyme S subunit